MKMEKLILIIIVLALVLMPVIRKNAEVEKCSCNICDFAAEVEKYDSVISHNMEARPDINNYKIYDCSELTTEILENRMDTKEVIVERCIGVVTDADVGSGMTLNTSVGYYISYRDVPDKHNGDIVVSYMIYNPNNNYTDDIMERYDFIVEK